MGIPQAQIDMPFDKLSAHRNWHWLWAIALGAIAFAFRLVPVLRGGGLFGLGNYDDGVYYAAATGLVHGRLPYQDFLLLHPPGMPLLLTPFALGAQLVSDSYGFAAARVAWMLLGALNAVLIWRILRPIGLVAALFGGLCYAVFYPAVYADKSTLLESPATTALLLAIILLEPVARASVVASWAGSCRRGAPRVGRNDQGLGGRYSPDRSWLVAARTPVPRGMAGADGECVDRSTDLSTVLRGGANSDVEPDRTRPDLPARGQRRHPHLAA